MRIPKPVNAVWDWAEEHGRLMAMLVLLPVLTIGALWAPSLAAFAIGVTVGVMVTYTRLSRRITRLRAEVDELLRDNGRLRHRNTMLESGIVREETVVTQKLLTIPGLDGAETREQRRSA
ncbi:MULTISPECIES: hypothetical protein [Thermomonospora]|uniref:Uncharacterized protein n=1 Tax=Thermomonospora curvata (strain ATCC 19995 / DSM 43183 / JCM 3096 / KCTC 9072 / NBRC 15933 / NCIMB 10081 / Henssen B9) TaxID=471852 RepID=D1AD35_THECD|nr:MULTISPECIES: hypothetical protein [Thermomonospora]ACY99344.1 hypothetical protein Tcur_3813 [Thermomonospora curvata DSM 43183]PKK12395.1 MAG: hypothetical protein BUE48_018690 [Thermomonospora sp. CIF 1]